MHALAETLETLAIFDSGVGQMLPVLALLCIFVGTARFAGRGRGRRRGNAAFHEARRRFIEALDEEASDAGRSVGGIYGSPAAQALTPDNQVAELYDPAVLQEKPPLPKRWRVFLMGFMKLTRRIFSFAWAILDGAKNR